MVRQGADGLRAAARTRNGQGQSELAVEIGPAGRQFQLDGRPVAPREYRGRLEVAVYSSARLKLVQGSMRERRAFLDRGAAALWPSYQQTLRGLERTLLQRNAALQRRAGDLEAWDERMSVLGGELRARRGEYAQRLTRAMAAGFRPHAEHYEVRPERSPQDGAAAEAGRLREELKGRRREELMAGRTLVGPQRDRVELTVDGRDAAEASSGQARSLLLSLTLATLAVYREERGADAVALLDDVDSELDDGRGHAFCARVSERGQALVTTAHPAWANALPSGAAVFAVAAGEVRPA
jgi:DNA replication and repair protein RecF